MSFLLYLFDHLVVFVVIVILTVIMTAVIGLPFIIKGILTNYGIPLCWQVWVFASLAWWMALFVFFVYVLDILNHKNKGNNL
jgi:hypothetical protein